tara:strand:+ start:177 stop:467 length:291 start_codon:yes stop_codon:yes gene_type:complete
MTNPPWRINDVNRGIVVDQLDRCIAVVPKAGAVPFNERQANLAVITAAPELLAALLEAAYILDTAGTPLNTEFYDLINRCRQGAVPLHPRAQRKNI